MIVWDREDPWGPNKRDVCVMCHGQLHPPLIVWHTAFDGEGDEGDNYQFGKFICNKCSVWMCHGLSLDMKQIVTAKKVGRLGFHRAGKRAAVSGGFLYTTGTNNKQ
jgi:hypothetical protein